MAETLDDILNLTRALVELENELQRLRDADGVTGQQADELQRLQAALTARVEEARRRLSRASSGSISISPRTSGLADSGTGLPYLSQSTEDVHYESPVIVNPVATPAVQLGESDGLEGPASIAPVAVDRLTENWNDFIGLTRGRRSTKPPDVGAGFRNYGLGPPDDEDDEWPATLRAAIGFQTHNSADERAVNELLGGRGGGDPLGRLVSALERVEVNGVPIRWKR